MTQPSPFAPDIQATQKAAAAPTSDFLAYTREELIREFPHLRTKDGTNRLLMGTYMDPDLHPIHVLELSEKLAGESPTLPLKTLQYARSLLDALSSSSTDGFQYTIGHPDYGVQIVATAPDLCASCEKPPPDGQCNPSHPDTNRRQELKRFYTVNHELAHLLGNMAGFEEKSIEQARSLYNQLQTQGASAEETREKATRWGSHILENSAEAFGILRTVQIYGDEGYHFMKEQEVGLLKDPARKGGAKQARYYPPQARADLLEWARAHQDELRTMSQGDLFHLALDKAPHLSSDQYLDLQNRASTDPASLSRTAALRRLRYGETALQMPYLRDHDARIMRADKDMKTARNQRADLNPYRPPEARGKGIPADGFSGTDETVNTELLRFGKERDPDCTTPKVTKRAAVHPKPSRP